MITKKDLSTALKKQWIEDFGKLDNEQPFEGYTMIGFVESSWDKLDSRPYPIGCKAKVNFAASLDFPDLRDKDLTILSIDNGMCVVEVDGKPYEHTLGLKGELIIM